MHSNNEKNKGSNKKHKVDADEEIIKKHFKERPSGLGNNHPEIYGTYSDQYNIFLGLGAEQQDDLAEDFNLDPLGKQLKRKFSQIKQRAEASMQISSSAAEIDGDSDDETLSKTHHSSRVVVHKKGQVLNTKHKNKKQRLH